MLQLAYSFFMVGVGLIGYAIMPDGVWYRQVATAVLFTAGGMLIMVVHGKTRE